MTEKIVTASDTSVGGDADEGGIAQNITLDDIRAVAGSPAPLEQRKARLRGLTFQSSVSSGSKLENTASRRKRECLTRNRPRP